VLVVDEMSMIDAMLWCHLSSILHHSGAKLIVAGDWAQLGPVCDVLLNIDCPTIQGRAFLHEKCGYRLRLETCRRSDARLFNFYTSLATSAEEVSLRVRRAREAFPPIPGPSPIKGCAAAPSVNSKVAAEISFLIPPGATLDASAR
jgi:hypothetical protein